MIRVINLILVIVCILLAVLLVNSVVKPMKIKNEIAEREQVVYKHIYKIKDAQVAFKSATDYFAANFDTLETVIINDDFIKVNRTTKDTTRISILDSLFKGDEEAVKQLRFVPFSNNKEFDMDAGVLEDPRDSTNLIPTFQVITYPEEFLSDFNKNNYENKRVKLGSMTAPILSGNWE